MLLKFFLRFAKSRHAIVWNRRGADIFLLPNGFKLIVPRPR
jgi:hypothetical protein